MTRNDARFIIATLIALAICAPTFADSLAQKLADAKPGSVITLPAGVFTVNGDNIPAGVTLRGAGYMKTVLDATGSTSGINIDSPGVTVTDLTIRGASGSALAVDEAVKIKIGTAANCRKRHWTQASRGRGRHNRQYRECSQQNRIYPIKIQR